MSLSSQYGYAILSIKCVFKVPCRKPFNFHIENVYTKDDHTCMVLGTNEVRQ